MRNILLIGAGRSTQVLVKYLEKNARDQNWQFTVADQSLSLAQKRVEGCHSAEAIELDINDESKRHQTIAQHDLVVSMLPAHMHLPVAKDCVRLKKHMVTASYISPEMEMLNAEARKNGVIIVNEIGVDPGIDHLSAMKVLNEIRESGGEITIFESFAGGLVAPECDNNPWGYKFTWNPRNVVLAGSGGAVKFKQEGKYKYIPYHMLFRRTEMINIEGYGRFEGYPNRDSLKYREVYGLQDVPTIFRGTLRRPGFCRSWDCFVKLGMTDDSYIIEDSENMTYRDFTNLFLAYNPQDSVELKLMHYLHIPQDSDLMDKLTWLGLFERKKIGLKRATPAQVLQQILEEKWQLDPDDRDMIVMYHKFGYKLKGEYRMMESHMVTKGRSSEETAMARTVGLPVGIAVKNILNGNIHTPGVGIPITKEIYEPMLQELAEHDIIFHEKETEYKGY